MQFLEENKVGFHIDSQIVPSVTGAVIYDLGVGNPAVRPSRADGYYAAKNASYKNLSQGAIGAGTGATVGKWNKNKSTPGGFGMDFVTLKNNIIVTAFVVTNAIGNIINPKTNSYYYDAGSFDESDLGFDTDKKRRTSLPNATTLAVIATNVDLNRPQLMKVAELAHDGMARSIYPVHTSLDGDTIFAISSLNGERMTLPRIPSIQLVDTIGILAGKTLASAIKHSIDSHGTIEP
jgi:L-aminopeptidase/D-esterase-like protein